MRRWWPWLKFVVGLALAVLALWALSSQRGELAGATGYLARIRWGWVVAATVAETGSLVAFAVMQQRLLQAGRVKMPLRRMTGVTLAATAIANSMPAGPVVSSVFAYRQYRRSGADEGLSAWTLMAVFVAASVSLAAVAAIGVAVAGAEGASADLVGVTAGVFVLAMGFGYLFLQRRALAWVITSLVAESQRRLRWPRGERTQRIDVFVTRITSVHLPARLATSAVSWGVANWLLDCGCLALAFSAVGVGVPWKGLLLAYGAGQLAANLPITPGGLGVVEGSLTIALVYFGGSNTSTVAAVLLYRILSFWLELPIGWSVWGWFAWTGRHQPSDLEMLIAPDTVAEVVAG